MRVNMVYELVLLANNSKNANVTSSNPTTFQKQICWRMSQGIRYTNNKLLGDIFVSIVQFVHWSFISFFVRKINTSFLVSAPY